MIRATDVFRYFLKPAWWDDQKALGLYHLRGRGLTLLSCCPHDQNGAHPHYVLLFSNHVQELLGGAAGF